MITRAIFREENVRGCNYSPGGSATLQNRSQKSSQAPQLEVGRTRVETGFTNLPLSHTSRKVQTGCIVENICKASLRAISLTGKPKYLPSEWLFGGSLFGGSLT